MKQGSLLDIHVAQSAMLLQKRGKNTRQNSVCTSQAFINGTKNYLFKFDRFNQITFEHKAKSRDSSNDRPNFRSE